MDIERFREHCLSIKEATESFPFIDPNVLVFKVAGKMFCMLQLNPKDGIHKADLKCNADYTLELREKYRGITPGHVPSTLLWHRVILESDVPDSLIESLIQHSVDEVIKTLPKKAREAYDSSPSQ